MQHVRVTDPASYGFDPADCGRVEKPDQPAAPKALHVPCHSPFDLLWLSGMAGIAAWTGMVQFPFRVAAEMVRVPMGTTPN